MTNKEIRILKALTNNKTIIAFSYIKPDFSNIDEVYINNLNVWYCNNSDIRPTTKNGKGIEITNGILLNPDNVIISKKIGGFELTEIDFINSELKLLNECTNLNPIETKQFEYYKNYLNKKKISTEWTLNDYYNRYIETKQFYNFFTNRIYKNHEYNSIKDNLNASNERFKYILNRLNTEDEKELINDYKDQLTQLKSKQTQSKFIELINETIQDIDVTPQQVENVKPDINNFLLNVKDKKEFLNDLSSTFTTEKGKSIKAIIIILIENKIFNIPDRTIKQFIDLLRNEFKQNIGTYTSINDADKIKPFYKEFLEPIENKLNPLINKHKTN